jgi:photosystem II stability/assembly factor-like uncharacterized protein
MRRSVHILITLFVLVCAAQPALAGRPRPDGPTPAEERWEAWELRQQLDEESLFAGLPWRCVGPVVQGGRLVDIAVHPDDPYTFWVAYASGGLWKTTNNGLSFEPLFDDQPTMIMGDIALDPRDPSTIWVGTGENNSSRSSYSGLGVFRSTDGGETFEHMGLSDADRIGRILVDPRDGNRVLVAVLGALYTEHSERGIFLTTDGGTTWERVLAGEGMTGFIDLVRDPADPDLLYAASWERSRRPWDFVEGGEGSGIWRSTDAGNTWSRLEGGFPRSEHVGRIGLATTPASPETIYAFLDNQTPVEDDFDPDSGAVTARKLREMSREEFLRQDPEEIENFVRRSDLHPDVDADELVRMVREEEVTLEQVLEALNDANANLFNRPIVGAQVWRSDDRGETWRLTHDEPIRQMVFTYGYYFGQIRVSPVDADQIWIMGVPILRSDDGGASWKGLDDRVVHVDYQSLYVDPSSPSRILVGNDGGLATSWDGGLTWLELNSVPVGQFYTIHVDMAEPYNIYGGLQDNGTWRGSSRSEPDDKNAWTFLNGGDGFYVQTDERDGRTTYAGYQFGYYTRIDADGSRHRVRPRNRLDEPALRYNWMTPVQLSAHNQDIVYFGSNMLWRSMDRGETWVAISDDLTRTDESGDVPFGTITSFDESALVFGQIVVATDDGQVWLTRDGGVDWEDISDGIPRDRWITRILHSPHERDRLFLTANGYRDDDMTAHVYRSDDLGGSWESISEGLPAEPVNVIREDPERPELLYVGTDRGAYLSRDGGASWTGLNAGLPNVPVHDLVIHPRDHELVAGTHGRSVWVVDVEPVQLLDDEIESTPLHVFPIEEIQARRGWRSKRSGWFYRPDEDESTHTYRVWSTEAGPASLSVLDDEGNLLRRAEIELVRGINQLEWDLRLDPDLALAVETTRQTDESDSTLAATPWAEAVRLEYPLYVSAGEYTLRVERGEASTEAKVTVKAPPSRDDRRTGPLTRPGRLTP